MVLHESNNRGSAELPKEQYYDARPEKLGAEARHRLLAPEEHRNQDGFWHVF
jgi:hypothetical protein